MRLRPAILLLGSLLLSGCASRPCDRVCAKLRAIPKDSDGCFPSQAVLDAAGVKTLDCSRWPGAAGSATLACGCILSVAPPPGAVTRNSIDDILASRWTPGPQLGYIVLSRMDGDEERVVCRLECDAMQAEGPKATDR
jgi:hypothetical protein